MYPITTTVYPPTAFHSKGVKFEERSCTYDNSTPGVHHRNLDNVETPY